MDLSTIIAIWAICILFSSFGSGSYWWYKTKSKFKKTKLVVILAKNQTLPLNKIPQLIAAYVRGIREYKSFNEKEFFEDMKKSGCYIVIRTKNWDGAYECIDELKKLNIIAEVMTQEQHEILYLKNYNSKEFSKNSKNSNSYDDALEYFQISQDYTIEELNTKKDELLDELSSISSDINFVEREKLLINDYYKTLLKAKEKTY